MTVYRLLVTEPSGGVLVVEFHDEAAAAHERAQKHQTDGYSAVVTRGTRDDDGTFSPT